MKKRQKTRKNKQCIAITEAGKRCTNDAMICDYCTMHFKQKQKELEK